MSEFVSTQSGNRIVSDLVHIIISHRDYLSEIDGAIGDGDHGINMRIPLYSITDWHRSPINDSHLFDQPGT